MTASDVLPSPDTPFGQRVRDRLRDEKVLWFTTVGRDGTPQPNPVWFLWTGDDEILTYNLPSAHRVTHIEQRPDVALNFNSSPDGGDVIVLRGRAERDDDAPSLDDHPEYLAKYAESTVNVTGSVESFAAAYSTAIRVKLSRVRGF